MAMNPSPNPPITIVGCGPGTLDYLTPIALSVIERAAVLVGTQRLLDLFPDHPAARVTIGTNIESALNQIAALLDRGPVAVLVTGDPGLASLARPVLRRFGRAICRVIPGVSSVQVAFARLGLDWLGARILSAHAAPPQVSARDLASETRIAILAGHAEAFHWSADLADQLGPGWHLFLCEDLTLPAERVDELNPATLRATSAGPRTIILLIREEAFS